MPSAELVGQAQNALLLSVALALPVLAVGALAGMLIAALQAATQIQDPTIAHLPRLLAVMAALIVLGPWMASEIGAFATSMFALAGRGW